MGIAVNPLPIIKDGGERETYASGMMREPEDESKPRFDLLWPLGIPYADQFLTRCAMQVARGAAKYKAPRNWELANSESEMTRMLSSAQRHFAQWVCGETDEDHAAALMFNVLAYETTKYKVNQSKTK